MVCPVVPGLGCKNKQKWTVHYKQLYNVISIGNVPVNNGKYLVIDSEVLLTLDLSSAKSETPGTRLKCKNHVSTVIMVVMMKRQW